MRYITLIRLLAFALLLLAIPVPSSAQVGIAITFGPPALPIYEQPPCPAEGYMWVPGYWAYGYDYDDYYWVPGTWVLAPEVGFFWTPGYWAWVDDRFVFYNGYWGPEVGFYGGINYGFGYFGEGYVGGRWDHDHFYYNQAVTNVNVTNIRNVYNNTTVINNTNVTRVSYNGGNGGVNARPTPQQEAAAHQRHVGPVQAQTQQVQAARSNPQLRASANQGKPPVAATQRPGNFGGGVVPARQAGAPYHPAPNRAAGRPAPAGSPAPSNNPSRPGAVVHPSDIPPRQAQSPPNTGNPRLDQKYQQQQEKLQAQQQRDRQKLQQRQDREHQRMQPQAPDNPRAQQLEQRHQQQTQQMQQRQSQQWDRMQQRQQPPRERQQPPVERRERPPH